MSLLLGNPIEVTNVGKVYPIKIKDHDRFSRYTWTVEKSKKSINKKDSEEPLIFLLMEEMQKSEEDGGMIFIMCLLELIKMVTREEVEFIPETISFKIGKSNTETVNGEEIVFESERFLNFSNFEEFREVVCKQNIIHEKRYHSKPFQDEIDRQLEIERKRNGGTSFDTVFQIISIKMGVTYDVISNMTYMQVLSNFQRIMLEKSYDTSVSFKVAGAECDIEDFTKDLDIFKHPEDTIIQRKKGK